MKTLARQVYSVIKIRIGLAIFTSLIQLGLLLPATFAAALTGI